MNIHKLLTFTRRKKLGCLHCCNGKNHQLAALPEFLPNIPVFSPICSVQGPPRAEKKEGDGGRLQSRAICSGRVVRVFMRSKMDGFFCFYDWITLQYLFLDMFGLVIDQVMFSGLLFAACERY